MPLSRVRQTVAAAGLFAAALASGLTLDASEVDGLVEPGAFGLDLRVAPELPESATLAVLAIAMAAGAFASGRKNVNP